MTALTRSCLLAAAMSMTCQGFAAIPINKLLESSEWQLESYADETCELRQLLPKSSIHATFDNGKLHGSGGCNQYSGQYNSTQEQRLSISDRIASTMMACAPAVSQQEQHYLSLLPKVTHYLFKDDALLMMNAQNQLILKYTVLQSAMLERTQWQASGINNGKGGVVSSTSTHMATVRFEEGKVSGSAGCNNFSASYTISGENLTIGPAMATRKSCAEPEGIMEQEQQFLQALQKSHTYKLGRDRLELRNEKGSLLVRFVVDTSAN
jgi:heat shock protein HslJ